MPDAIVAKQARTDRHFRRKAADRPNSPVKSSHGLQTLLQAARVAQNSLSQCGRATVPLDRNLARRPRTLIQCPFQSTLPVLPTNIPDGLGRQFQIPSHCGSRLSLPEPRRQASPSDFSCPCCTGQLQQRERTQYNPHLLYATAKEFPQFPLIRLG